MAIPEVIKLDEEDIRTGLYFAIQTARAQARLQAISDSEHEFIERMQGKYKIDTNQYRLVDWISGFQRIV